MVGSTNSQDFFDPGFNDESMEPAGQTGEDATFVDLEEEISFIPVNEGGIGRKFVVPQEKKHAWYTNAFFWCADRVGDGWHFLKDGVGSLGNNMFSSVDDSEAGDDEEKRLLTGGDDQDGTDDDLGTRLAQFSTPGASGGSTYKKYRGRVLKKQARRYGKISARVAFRCCCLPRDFLLKIPTQDLLELYMAAMLVYLTYEFNAGRNDAQNLGELYPNGSWSYPYYQADPDGIGTAVDNLDEPMRIFNMLKHIAGHTFGISEGLITGYSVGLAFQLWQKAARKVRDVTKLVRLFGANNIDPTMLVRSKLPGSRKWRVKIGNPIKWIGIHALPYLMYGVTEKLWRNMPHLVKNVTLGPALDAPNVICPLDGINNGNFSAVATSTGALLKQLGDIPLDDCLTRTIKAIPNEVNDAFVHTLVDFLKWAAPVGLAVIIGMKGWDFVTAICTAQSNDWLGYGKRRPQDDGQKYDPASTGEKASDDDDKKTSSQSSEYSEDDVVHEESYQYPPQTGDNETSGVVVVNPTGVPDGSGTYSPTPSRRSSSS